MMTSYPSAPVVLLGFNRPDLTAQVFATIRAAKPAKLFLVMDGPRSSHPDDADLVARTREVVAHIDWDCEVVRDYAETNLGLKKRISSGLDRVFSHVEKAIILEDDCVPDATFFPFVSELLERYEKFDQVGILGGTSRLRGHRVSDYSYDFSRDIRIWGWATWARTWQGFQASGDLDATWSDQEQARILATLPGGARQQAMKVMLKRAQDLDSWALPFAVHCQNRGYLSVVPEVNLVENIGFGARSTHTTFEDFVAQVSAEPIEFPLRHPESVVENPLVDRWESRLDQREWRLYPLRHPWDVAGRVWRYLVVRIRMAGKR
jgi:hypothetical protein